MGRAFPHLEMTTFGVYGCAATPSVLMDDSGNVVHVHTTTNRIAEDVVRSVCASLGSMIFGSFYPMSGRQVKQLTVHDTVTHTLEIGRRIRTPGSPNWIRSKACSSFSMLPRKDATRASFSTAASLTCPRDSRWLALGRCSSVAAQAASRSFGSRSRTSTSLRATTGDTVTIVPDLIAILDAESAEPLTAEMLAYGQRVRVIGYSAAPIMRRPECLKVFGPRLFGLDEDFRPVEELRLRANEGQRGCRIHIWAGHGIKCGAVRTPGRTPVAYQDLARRVHRVLRRVQHAAGYWGLHGYFQHDYALMVGMLASLVTCGSVTVLAMRYTGRRDASQLV